MGTPGSVGLALLEVDYLGQWSHLLIEVSKWGCPQYGPGSTPPPFGTGGLPRVLVACEQSQVISSRFANSGWAHAASVDLLPNEMPGYAHLIADAAAVFHLGWDFICAPPPCTHLCLASGCYWARPGRMTRLARAAHFFLECYYAPSAAVLVENPKQTPRAREAIGVAPTCTIHPHNHGCGVTKPTQLWLRGGLGPLLPSHQVEGRAHALTTMTAPGPLRSLIKGRTFDGVGRAIVSQYLPVLVEAKMAISRQKVELAVKHRMNRVYGEIGNLVKGLRADNSARASLRRGAAVIATVMKRCGPRVRGQPCPSSLDWVREAANRLAVSSHQVGRGYEAWCAWKRNTELHRGRLFGTEVDSTPPARWDRSSADRGLWMKALTALHDHCLLTRRLVWEGKTAEAEALRPPVPPVRRVMKRYGKWWVWCPTAGTTQTANYAYEWKRLPEECQEALDDSTEHLRPAMAAVCLWGPRAGSYRVLWHRWRQGLVRRPAANNNSRDSGALITRIWEQAGMDGRPCPACSRPRSGASEGCPRGLGASTCDRRVQRPSRVSFVRATAALTGQAKLTMERAVIRWREKRKKRGSLFAATPKLQPLVAEVLLRRHRALAAKAQRIRPPRRDRKTDPPTVQQEGRSQPIFTALTPPEVFGEKDIAEAAPLAKGSRTFF